MTKLVGKEVPDEEKKKMEEVMESVAKKGLKLRKEIKRKRKDRAREGRRE